MDKKIKFTPEQLTELQSFFQKNDFTANMTLDREYDFSAERSEIFVRAKRIFGDYWLGNLRPLGVNRKMKIRQTFWRTPTRIIFPKRFQKSIQIPKC